MVDEGILNLALPGQCRTLRWVGPSRGIAASRVSGARILIQ